MSEKVAIGSLDDFPQGAKRVDIEGHRVAVVRIGDDFYALGDRCTHADYSLSEGDVYEEDLEIECWKHGSTFSLKTGRPTTLPATRPVPVYEIEVEQEKVWLKLP
ncbi:MAG: non-heme iron oxygenase ferredoxin subunit [Actinomycetota bacterium]|nr:non-heme iron oxygenase ferredoxin subunit [Actinomycetota bacterium]MDA8209503.1 non-heme iron oxygenase ferredoxin subunit [Actinomycetota bacterium]